MKVFQVIYNNFIYRIYKQDESKIILTLQKKDSEVEKEVGVYFIQEEKLVKKVQDGNIFKKYNGFGVGSFWLNLLSPSILEFHYKNKVYQFNMEKMSKEVSDQILLVKFENYESQKIFPRKLLCLVKK